MPIPGNSDGPNVFHDLIDWQSQAVTEPLEVLRVRVYTELNEFRDMLVVLNRLLRQSPCQCGCNFAAVSDTTYAAMRLSMSVAICVLGIAYRNPGGLTIVPVPDPSDN